jgi:hypothetical protein
MYYVFAVLYLVGKVQRGNYIIAHMFYLVNDLRGFGAAENAIIRFDAKKKTLVGIQIKTAGTAVYRCTCC